MEQQLHWPLTVLSRSINYKNLTAASQQIGISQPQLSRLIKQLETSLKVVLLDRKSPRHTTWTSEARMLAEIFNKSEKALNQAIEAFRDGSQQKELSIGCLEGLSSLAKQYGHRVLSETSVETLHLNVFDQNDLEAKFLIADLDIVFTSRSPSNRKFQWQKNFGYQYIETFTDRNTPLKIHSTFEFNNQSAAAKRRNSKRMISNNLYLRRSFQEQYGGSIRIPSSIMKGKPPQGAMPVIAIGQDYLSGELWKKLNGLSL